MGKVLKLKGTHASIKVERSHPNIINKKGGIQKKENVPVRETRSQSKPTEPPRRFTRGSVPAPKKEERYVDIMETETIDVSKIKYNSEKDRQDALKREKASNYYKSYHPDVLSNLSFVLTGVLSLTRDLVSTIIRKHGGYVMSKVDKTTDYVVMGDKVGHNKTSKAKQFNIPTISEDQLFKIMRGNNSVTLTDPDTVRKRFPDGPPVFSMKKRKIRKHEPDFDEYDDLDMEEDEEQGDGWCEEEDDKQIASIIQGWGREEALLYLIEEMFVKEMLFYYSGF